MTEDRAIEDLHGDIDLITGKAYGNAGKTTTASRRIVEALLYHAALRAIDLGESIDAFIGAGLRNYRDAEVIAAQAVELGRDIDGHEDH